MMNDYEKRSIAGVKVKQKKILLRMRILSWMKTEMVHAGQLESESPIHDMQMKTLFRVERLYWNCLIVVM